MVIVPFDDEKEVELMLLSTGLSHTKIQMLNIFSLSGFLIL